jgi:hypothetical protein
MEGNPLFPEESRHPTDEEIRLAQDKDDSDLKQLAADVQKAFDDLKGLGDGGKVQGSRLTDYLQHRLEPLMARAAEIGDIPAAQKYIPALKAVIVSCLTTLKKSAGVDLSIESFEPTWKYKTCVFIAQCHRDDTPIDRSDAVRALLCESTQTVENVLNIYRELDSGVTQPMREMARLHLELADLDGFALPGRDEKLALFDAAAG